MKMIVAVVRDEFVPALSDSLTRKGFGATKLASTGGFLRAGNTTFLIGVPAGQLDDALGIIQAACPSKKGGQKGTATAEELLSRATTNPAGVDVGGATVFVLGVERMVKV